MVRFSFIVVNFGGEGREKLFNSILDKRCYVYQLSIEHPSFFQTKKIMKILLFLITYLSPILAVCQYSPLKSLKSMELQVNEVGKDSISVNLLIEFKKRESLFFLTKKAERRWKRKAKYFKQYERKSIVLAKDTMMTITFPPAFFNDGNLIIKKEKGDLYGYPIEWIHAAYLDHTGERCAYPDTIGHGQLYIQPDSQGFNVAGYLGIMQSRYFFNEHLLNGEFIRIGDFRALAIKLKNIQSGIAEVMISINSLNTSKTTPSTLGFMFRTYYLPINSNSPTFVGYKSGSKGKSVNIDNKSFIYIPTWGDRDDNGSLLLTESAEGKFRLRGVYSAFSETFMIDNELILGQEVGIKN